MKNRRWYMLVVGLVIALAGIAEAQGGRPGLCPGGWGPGSPMGGPMSMRGAGMGPGFGGPGMGKWWKNSALVKQLGVSDVQVQQIEKVFQDRRPQLIDLRAALEKEEAKLEPLIDADRPNEPEVTAQIEKVAQARTNLEKSNALMLLGIRRVLTVEQWKQLQSAGCCMGMTPGARGGGPPLRRAPSAN